MIHGIRCPESQAASFGGQPSQSAEGPDVGDAAHRRVKLLPRVSRRVAVGAILAVGLVAAACSSGTSAVSNTATTGSKATTVSAIVIGSATNPTLGKILVNPTGATLYRFAADQNGQSSCTGACAQLWPPLTVTDGSQPKAASGLVGVFGTSKRGRDHPGDLQRVTALYLQRGQDGRLYSWTGFRGEVVRHERLSHSGCGRDSHHCPRRYEPIDDPGTIDAGHHPDHCSANDTHLSTGHFSTGHQSARHQSARHQSAAPPVRRRRRPRQPPVLRRPSAAVVTGIERGPQGFSSVAFRGMTRSKWAAGVLDPADSTDLAPSAALTNDEGTRRRVVLPTMAIAASTMFLVVRGFGSFGDHSSLASAVAAERWTLVGPLMLGVVAVAIIAEQIRPAVRRPLWARGHVHDGLYLILYAVAVVPLVVLIGTGSSAIVHQIAPWLAISRPSFVPAWFEAVVVLFAIDWLNWLAHLANHRIPSLWRLHAVHHSQEELSVLTAFRAHPLVHVSFLVALIPALVLVGAGPIPAVVFAIYAGYGAMTHANIRWGSGHSDGCW